MSILESRRARGRPRRDSPPAGQDYFGMYWASMTGVLDRLAGAGLLSKSKGAYALTPAGRPLAETLRSQNPKHLYFYNEYFTRAQHSRAHATFCARVYGRTCASTA